jgi:hypothetical protein
MAKLDDVASAMVAKYGVSTASAQEMIARTAASTWGVFQNVYPEFSPGDKFWNDISQLIAGAPYEPKS